MLTGELCGWSSSRVSVFPDWPQPGDLHAQLITLFQDANDVALFYYVGHGLIDAHNKLCLSLTETREDRALQAATSLAYDQVQDALWRSPATTKIVVLDCCYAGKATSGQLEFGVMQDLTRLLQSAGTYTLAAVAPYEKAWFETSGGPGARPQTYFTKQFLDVIEKGIPGAGPELRIDQIFNEAQETLAMDSIPVPTSWASGRASQLIFAENASPDKFAPLGQGEPRPVIINANQPVTALAFSPDRRYLATGSWRSLRLWDLEADDYVWRRSFGKLKNLIGFVAFSLDGRSLASLGSDSIVRVWDTTPPRDEPSMSFNTEKTMAAMAFRGDGHLIIAGRGSNSGRGSKSIWIQSVAGDGEQQVNEIQHPGDVRSMALSADGSIVATGGDDGFARIWDTGNLQKLGEIPHAYDVRAVALSANGEWLATGGLSVSDLGWIVRTFRLPGLEAGHYFFHGPVTAEVMGFSGDGRRVATGDVEGFARVWSTVSGRQLRKIKSSSTNLFIALALNRDGGLLATSAGLELIVRLLEIPSGSEG